MQNEENLNLPFATAGLSNSSNQENQPANPQAARFSLSQINRPLQPYSQYRNETAEQFCRSFKEKVLTLSVIAVTTAENTDDDNAVSEEIFQVANVFLAKETFANNILHAIQQRWLVDPHALTQFIMEEGNYAQPTDNTELDVTNRFEVIQRKMRLRALICLFADMTHFQKIAESMPDFFDNMTTLIVNTTPNDDYCAPILHIFSHDNLQNLFRDNILEPAQCFESVIDTGVSIATSFNESVAYHLCDITAKDDLNTLSQISIDIAAIILTSENGLEAHFRNRSLRLRDLVIGGEQSPLARYQHSQESVIAELRGLAEQRQCVHHHHHN